MISHKVVLNFQSNNLIAGNELLISQNKEKLFSGPLVPTESLDIELYVYFFCPGIVLNLNSESKEVCLLSLTVAKSVTLIFNDCDLIITLIPKASKDLKCSIRGIDLDDLDTFDLSDPYFILYSNSNEFYRSEVIWDNLNPVWKEFVISENVISSLIKINVWDKDLNNDDFIGSCEIQTGDLLVGEIQVPIHNPKKKGTTKSGELVIKTSKIINLVEKIYNYIEIGVVYMICCNHDYKESSKLLVYLNRCFGTVKSDYVGFGSAESFSWSIQSGPDGAFSDQILDNKTLGPCLLGPSLMKILRNKTSNTYWIFCILLSRDVLDPKTVTQVLLEVDEMPFSFRAFIPSNLSSTNLSQIKNLKTIKYSYDSLENDVSKELHLISSEIEKKIN